MNARIARRRVFRSRPGKVMVMTMLLMPVLFGTTLMSSDTAVLVNAEAQMKSMADASALAGAMALAAETRLQNATDISSLMTDARSRAITVASRNSVLGVSGVLANNVSNTMSGDIVIGTLSPSDSTSTMVSTAGSQTLYNAVTVTARRDSSHGGQIPTFFGGPLGIGSRDMTVKSTAIAQNYQIRGMQSVNNGGVNLLPIVLDKANYDAMMSRTTADQYRYTESSSSVSAGADGVPESQLYPTGTGNPGNFGTVKIGVTNNSTSTLVSQITDGISAAQMATFPGGRIELNTALSPPSITFGGNPGLSAGIKSALTAKIGETAVIGIYDQTGGNGNNSTYRVVAFAPIRIMAVNFQGNPKYVVVQPALINDPSFIPGTVETAWTKGGAVRVLLAR